MSRTLSRPTAGPSSRPTIETHVSARDGERAVEARFLGQVPYDRAVELQEEIRDDLLAGRGGEVLLLLEHPHVYTLGRNAEESDVTASPEWLAEHEVEVARCDRGGQVTYHGPGQLVGYPILNLDPDRRDVGRYVRDLQEVLVRTLADYGIEAEGRSEPGIGVWVGDAKIASIGVHLKRWVTTHGFALNVTTELSMFAGIVACGLDQVRMTSIATLTGNAPPLQQVGRRCGRHFAAVFERALATSAPAASG